MRRLYLTIPFLLGALAVACSATVVGGGGSDDDAGSAADGSTTNPTTDSGSTPKKDSGSQDDDAGLTPTPDASKPLDGSTVPFDAGKPKDAGKPDAAVSACYDSSGAAAYVWTGNAAVNQNKCTAAQISGYFDACLGPNATQATCTAFDAVVANQNCERCIQGSAANDNANAVKNLPPPALLPITVDGSDYLYLNTATCAAGVLGLSTCSQPVSNIVACEYGSCEACDANSIDGCIDYADADVCSSILSSNQATCFTPITNGKATWEPACTGGQTSFDKVFPVLAAKMCGP